MSLLEGERLQRFGRPTSEFPLRAQIQVRSPEVYAQLALGGSVGAAESWMRGDWYCDDLAALVRILLRNQDAMGRLDRPLSRSSALLRRATHALRRNTRSGSRRNISEHYDLGNDFFSLLLDPTLTYSAGIFDSADCSMQQASLAKYDRLSRRLALRSSDHVLEIGSGWGGFALRAASAFGCRVTTTTVSEQQFEVVRERVAAAGLVDRIRVLHEDYRDLRGSFDKLASIEMIEAVGHQYFETYFRTCAERLAPDGLMAIQAITISDQRYRQARDEVDFIKKYIFPGGCLPSLGELLRASSGASDLRALQVEDITPHYAETLRRWRQSFRKNSGAIRALGYSERFMRMWEFYLGYCEGGFEERAIGTVQMLFARPGWRGEVALGGLR